MTRRPDPPAAPSRFGGDGDPAASGTRIVLHTGKGGVGKTTVSAITGLALARTGQRVLLLSTDPAHSLADVLDSPVGSDPTQVPGVPNLLAAQVDTMARYEQAWSAIRDYLVGVLSARGMADVQAEELVTVPGAEEIVALLEVHRYARSSDVDVVVVDCAPSGDTLRLLAVPETVNFYAGRLMGTPARLLRTVAASLAGIPSPGTPVRDAVGELLADLGRVREMLADSRTTSVRLVLTPETVVLSEARRLRTALALHGFGVDAVFANRVLPPEADGAFLAGWRAAQREALVHVEESFGDLPVRQVPMTPAEPVGPAMLSALAARVFGAQDPLEGSGRAPSMTVTSRRGGGYRLALPLPHAERGSVSLARSGDELVITLGGQRRRLALPSVLRRCEVTAARFTGMPGRSRGSGARVTMMIDFAPDPVRWPASLAGSLNPDAPSAVPPAADSADRAGSADRADRADRPLAASR